MQDCIEMSHPFHGNALSISIFHMGKLRLGVAK